jgi:hypothetical protein
MDLSNKNKHSQKIPQAPPKLQQTNTQKDLLKSLKHLRDCSKNGYFCKKPAN